MLPASPYNKIQFTLAMLLGAAVPFLTQSLNLDHVHPAFTAFARAALSLLSIVILCAITLQSPMTIKGRDWISLALAGIFLGAGWYCHIRGIALAHVPASEAAFAIYPLASIVLLRQSPFHISYIFLIFIALIGVTLALPDMFVLNKAENLGVAYSLGAVLLQVISGRFVMKIYKLYPPDRTNNAILLIQYLFATILLLPAIFLTPPAQLTLPIAGKLVAIGFFIAGFSRLLMSASAHRMNPAHAAAIYALQPFVAIVLAALLLGGDEIPSFRIIIGAVIVTLCSLAATIIQRVGPSAIFRAIRWN